MTTRDVAERQPWNVHLRRHQDWDWVIRSCQDPDVRLVQLPQPLAIYTVGSENSMSAEPDWFSSYTWALSQGQSWQAATLADFLAAQSLRYAVQARDWAGVAAVCTAIRTTGRPSPHAIASAVLGAVPRRTAEKVALQLGAFRRDTATTTGSK